MKAHSKLRKRRPVQESSVARQKQLGMLTSIQIKGFRGFRDLVISKLAPITVFTGKNGAGKTTILEAILALHGRLSPTWVSNLQAHHGFARFSPSTGPNYSGVFYEFRDTGSAVIEGDFNPGGANKLVVERSIGSSHAPVTASQRPSTSVDAPSPDFVCKSYRNAKLIHQTALKWIYNPPQLPQPSVENPREPERRALLLHPTGQVAGSDEAERLGDAKESGRKGRIIQGLQLLDGRIKDVEFLKTSTAEYFAATIDGLPRPFGLLGAGINHVFRYLVNLDFARGGCLLIDEVENGIHYSVLEKVFSTLIQSAIHDKTQLILTTHSGEALAAIGRTARNLGKNALTVVHLSREDNDFVRASVFSGADAASSLQLGYELR